MGPENKRGGFALERFREVRCSVDLRSKEPTSSRTGSRGFKYGDVFGEIRSLSPEDSHTAVRRLTSTHAPLAFCSLSRLLCSPLSLPSHRCLEGSIHRNVQGVGNARRKSREHSQIDGVVDAERDQARSNPARVTIDDEETLVGRT